MASTRHFKIWREFNLIFRGLERLRKGSQKRLTNKNKYTDLQAWSGWVTLSPMGLGFGFFVPPFFPVLKKCGFCL